MKAVFSAAQLAHAPRHFLSKGNIIDYPESPERARLLLAGAKSAGAQIFAARKFDAEKLLAVHAKPYLELLEFGFDEFSKLADAGPELLPSLRPLVRPTQVSSHILGRAGGHMMDFSCPIAADTWRSAEASAMTALTAAEFVIKGEPVSYALCRPPGHHAYGAAAGGFCYLNNAAIAAQHLKAKMRRVAILDIDVHHGNGTQAIFYKRNDVLTVSIHADPDEFYPFYWGYESETGQGHGEGYNLNIPVPVKSGDAIWCEALEKACEKIIGYDAGALVVSLGLDAHEDDPLGGGAVTTSGFERMGGRIAGLNLPTVIVQEGGYLNEHLGDNLAMFLVGFQGGREQFVDSAAS
jgi:acetoin utilization deacetylase AcuC-like enzyme